MKYSSIEVNSIPIDLQNDFERPETSNNITNNYRVPLSKNLSQPIFKMAASTMRGPFKGQTPERVLLNHPSSMA